LKKTTKTQRHKDLKILIIGGTRFIGPYLLRHLVEAGHKIAVFHRGKTEADLPSGIIRINGDRKNLVNYKAEFESFAPEVVIDLIPYTEQEALDAMRVFKGLVGRFVAISSMDVYRAYDILRRVRPGPPDKVPLSEDSPLREQLYPYRSASSGPDDMFYNYEKILVEKRVMGDRDLAGTILRLPAVYGPGDYQHRVFEFLKRMIDKRPKILLEEGRANWRWTRGYVDNVAAAIALAASDERAAGKIYNVGEEDTFTEIEWVRSIGQTAGWEGEIVTVPKEMLPDHLTQPFNWEQDLYVDCGRIKMDLGYKDLISRKDALKETVSWERNYRPDEAFLKQFDYAAEDSILAKLN
jgi:nucleoside-diphosphate-sugar epimerase